MAQKYGFLYSWTIPVVAWDIKSLSHTIGCINTVHKLGAIWTTKIWFWNKSIEYPTKALLLCKMSICSFFLLSEPYKKLFNIKVIRRDKTYSPLRQNRLTFNWSISSKTVIKNIKNHYKKWSFQIKLKLY